MKDDTYLRERLDKQIHWYDEKSQQHQKWYKCYKRIEIVFSVVIPITAPLDLDFFPLVSSVSASIILLCEGLIALSKHRDNWIDYRRTTELLKHEKYMYLTHTGVYKNEEDSFALLVERCETIISSENINWANLQTDTEKRKGNKHGK